MRSPVEPRMTEGGCNTCKSYRQTYSHLLNHIPITGSVR